MMDNRYLYPVVVTGTGAGCVFADGKTLRVIGNLLVRPGDTVYTDGRIVYGHSPVREHANLPVNSPGVPFIGIPIGTDKEFQGYYTDAALRKPKHIGNVTNDSFITNNNSKLFLDRNPYRKVIDAEILANEQGKSIGYSIATAKKNEEICSENKSEILVENSLGTRSETIALNNKDFAELVAEDFAEVAGAKDYKYTSYNTQYLNFRFTDELGNWELIVGVNVYNLSLMRSDDVPDYVGHPLFTVQEVLSREILSREPFIGATDVVRCKETITVTSVQSGEYQSQDVYKGEYWQKVEKAFAAVRLNSDGKLEIVHRNYYIDEGYYFWITGWTTETNTHEWSDSDYPYSMNALPEGVVSERKDSWTQSTGSYSYYINYGVLHTDEDIIGASVLGTGWWGFSGTTTSVSYRYAITEEAYPPSVWQINDLAIDMPDSFKAALTAPNTPTDQFYGKLSITDGNTTIIDDYDHQHSPLVQFSTQYGLIRRGSGSQRWFFPHVCGYRFPKSNKAIIAEFGGRLWMCENGQAGALDRNMQNFRLRRMRRIVRTPASKLEPGQNIN